MKTTEKRMTRCALYAVWALAATALTGCSEELSQMFSETTRVEVEARFVPMDDMKTRAADGLDVGSTGFSVLTGSGSGQSTSSTVNVKVDDGSANYTAYTYDITGSTAIAPASAAPVFPAAVNSVSVYGWYPANGGSASFSIQSDQQSNVSYCLSDLMLANSASCTRDGNSVTPAALAFRHVMSKVKLVLTLGTDVTITDVALKNVKPTVAIDESNPASLTVGSASGSAGDVTLLSSGSITSASALAARTLAAVIPAQTISGSFITITASLGGTPSTITYSFDAGSKTFASGKEYTANIAVDGTLTGSPTVSLDAWAGSEGTVNIETGAGGPVTLSSYTLDLTYGGSAGTLTASAGGSSYSATSADPSVATVSVSGSTITVTPVGVGSTQVIVVGTQGGVINSSICTVTVAKGSGTRTDPTAVANLVYNGSAQALVTAGSSSHGSYTYCLTQNGTYTSSVPTQTNVGTYTVYWRFTGDANHSDATGSVSGISIAKGAPTKTDPAKKTNLTYNGSAQALVTAGSSSHGSYTYCLTQNGTYSASVPTQTNAGTYTVYWRFTGDANHSDATGSVSGISIAKKAPSITLSKSAMSFSTLNTNNTFTITYNGDGTLSAVSSNTSKATVSLSGSTATVHSVANGSATITVTASAGNNYLAYTASDKTVAVTINADPGVSLASATVGMIVASNGKAYTTSNWSDSYGTKVAVVGYKNGSSGYAVALVNASQNTWNSITNYGEYKNKNCTLADGKRGSVPVAPTGTTWKVLNEANYKLVWQAMGSADTYNATSNARITAAGGTALSGTYWSTQENSSSRGYFFNSNGWNSNGDKANSFNVRPVLAW